MSNNSFWYRVKYTDKKGQLQDTTVMAENTEIARERVKSENEVREIQSSIEMPSGDEFKEALNNPFKKKK